MLTFGGMKQGTIYQQTITEDSCSQFHQHFMYNFFVQMLLRQLFSSYMYVEEAAKMMFIQKILCVKHWWNWLLYFSICIIAIVLFLIDWFLLLNFCWTSLFEMCIWLQTFKSFINLFHSFIYLLFHMKVSISCLKSVFHI